MSRPLGVLALSMVIVSSSWTGVRAEVVEETVVETSTPVLLIPTAVSEDEGSLIELDLQPGQWRAKLQRGQARDVIAVSASRQIGSVGKAFAKWRQADGPATVEAGLECSLFGADHWRASHRVSPTANDPSETAITKLSLGVEVSDAASITFCRNQTGHSTEFGSGLSYKTQGGLEWGASLKSRRLNSQETEPFWKYPSLESSLRWSW